MSFINTYFGFVQQGGVTPFDPTQISGLTAWYGDLVNNGTDRNTLSNNASITQWDDQSGNDYHIDSVSGSITYDATNDNIDTTAGVLYHLTHPIATGSSNRTVFLVGESAEGAGASNYFYFIGYYDASGGDYYSTIYSSTNNLRLDSSSQFRDFTGSFSTNTPTLITVGNTGTTTASAFMRKNGSDLSVNGTVEGGGFDTNVGISFGGYLNGNTPTDYGSMSYQEFIVYNRALTTTEIEDVERYLNIKYGIY